MPQFEDIEGNILIVFLDPKSLTHHKLLPLHSSVHWKRYVTCMEFSRENYVLHRDILRLKNARKRFLSSDLLNNSTDLIGQILVTVINFLRLAIIANYITNTI